MYIASRGVLEVIVVLLSEFDGGMMMTMMMMTAFLKALFALPIIPIRHLYDHTYSIIMLSDRNNILCGESF